MKVFLSVYDKTPRFNELVYHLHKLLGCELIASGETFKHIKDVLNMSVTHAGEITGLKPVEGKENILDHRVETLCPQIHGGLLADETRHMEELGQLGWPFIGMVVCTFYPLAKTMEEHAGDFEAINKQVDIGGPTMIRSAMKGGRIVVVDENDFEWIAHWPMYNPRVMSWLRSKAAAWIAQYTATEAVFRANEDRPR